jgi:P27 family predicted phage terminase small subunit
VTTRGRKPKPTETKKLAGNPGKRKINEQEPKPDVVIPAAPDHLDGPALEEWYRITEELKKLRMITAIDRAVLITYCQAWGDYIKACDEVEKEGEVLFSDKGNAYQNPWTGIKTSAMDRMLRISAEFGMTPSSRSRLKVEMPTEEDEMKGMLMRTREKGTKR